MAHRRLILWSRTLPAFLMLYCGVLVAGPLLVGASTMAASIFFTAALVIGVYSLVLLLLALQRSRRARRLIEQPTVHWEYDEATWNHYLDDYACGWTGAARVALFVGTGLGVLMLIVEPFNGTESWSFGIWNVIGGALIGGGCGLTIVLAGALTRRRVAAAPREAFVGEGIYIAGQFHATGEALVGVKVTGAEPAWLEFQYVIKRNALESGYEDPELRSGRIPVPPDKEAEAKKIRPNAKRTGGEV